MIFNHIGVFTNSSKKHVTQTIAQLLPILLHSSSRISYSMPEICSLDTPAQRLSEPDLLNSSDLIIVVGGDGNFLKAARAAIDSEARLLGVNCGRLGFLTDLNPHKLEQELKGILQGEYQQDQRSLLAAYLDSGEQLALNDIVVRGVNSHMAELGISIDGTSIARLRCDGLIIATPTGATAYALSAGGPLLHPSMPAFVIVPIAAHSLNARPIVVSDSSALSISLHSRAHLWLDGVTGDNLKSGAELSIGKARKSISIIHPLNYEYFEVCRQKLGWNSVIGVDPGARR